MGVSSSARMPGSFGDSKVVRYFSYRKEGTYPRRSRMLSRAVVSAVVASSSSRLLYRLGKGGAFVGESRAPVLGADAEELPRHAEIAGGAIEHLIHLKRARRPQAVTLLFNPLECFGRGARDAKLNFGFDRVRHAPMAKMIR